MQERTESLSAQIGLALRDSGIRRAADHAEAESPGWAELAYDILKIHGPRLELFTATDMRAMGITLRLPRAPDQRAWGGVMKRAANAGLIEFSHYQPHNDPKSHRMPQKVWRWVQK